MANFATRADSMGAGVGARASSSANSLICLRKLLITGSGVRVPHNPLCEICEWIPHSAILPFAIPKLIHRYRINEGNLKSAAKHLNLTDTGALMWKGTA